MRESYPLNERSVGAATPRTRTAACSGSGALLRVANDNVPKASLTNRMLSLTTAPFVIVAASIRTAWAARKEAA